MGPIPAPEDGLYAPNREPEVWLPRTLTLLRDDRLVEELENLGAEPCLRPAGPARMRRDYFLCSARVRMSLAAVVRRVSGTFLFMASFFRSTALRRGSMCRETSSGVIALFKRLRTTT